ncbi:hypothetical protein LTR36_009093 [Oleoguttula mirabilis]|uniref:FAD-binding domain-containing protein n=1 Tax=Oleoguttula mirabilis TaxID=1507867 RepID=A0AAV9J771_9PEZI|nr:hypothetical protein LTR36_009093 [Oleoguttula mirabilis]
MAVKVETPVLKVAIVGGGPGGLATAVALRAVPGLEVTLYERAEVLREVGAGISIPPNSWNVLDLLGVDSLTSGHPTTAVLNMNGKTGEELHRVETGSLSSRKPIRTQRTALQAALLAHVPKDSIQLGKKVLGLDNLGPSGVRLTFADGSTTVAGLVVGADGIRSVVRDSVWPEYPLSFTGTTIWRVLLPVDAIKDLDPRFMTTGWWHGPTTHVYFSLVGEGMWEIAARAWQDPKIHGSSKVSWGTPVENEVVEANFTEYLPQVREALHRVPKGHWREFAAFAGPNLATLTGWNNRVVLVGDSSHALSGAFGSGAGFAMEDGWVLAQALASTNNDLSKALPLFDKIRVPYYTRMYAHLDNEAKRRALHLSQLLEPSDEERVRNKVIKIEGTDMKWIYANDIGKVWRESVAVVA